jgi:outer membrane lipoprotein-sorting protein
MMLEKRQMLRTPLRIGISQAMSSNHPNAGSASADAIFALLLALVVSIFSPRCRAQATQPVTLSTKSSLDDVLDALDARGQNLQDFTADIKLSDSDNVQGNTTASIGTVVFQRKPNGDARIRVHFTLRQDDNGQTTRHEHDYSLENGVLVERQYEEKKQINRRVLKPGQKLDLFKLGQGPFPLPLGQKKEDVEELFDAKKIDPAPGDPPGTVHVQLTPKPDSQFARDFSVIDIWVDDQTNMPARIQTVDANNTATKTTDLTHIRLNTGVSDPQFAAPPLPSGSDIIDDN